MALPGNYATMFGNGTMPSDWTTEPPAPETLRHYLEEQPSRIQETFSDRLSVKLPTPIKLGPYIEMETIGEVLYFTLFHEGMHKIIC